jgi:putative transcriptional regulator
MEKRAVRDSRCCSDGMAGHHRSDDVRSPSNRFRKRGDRTREEPGRIQSEDVKTDEGAQGGRSCHNRDKPKAPIYKNGRMGRPEMNKPEHFSMNGRAEAPVPYHYVECGLDNIYLLNGFTFDECDGEEYVSIENVDGLWKAIGLNIVTKKKMMSPKEIRFLRGQMDMTQSELAAMLRVDDQTVARWEKGRVRLPGPADLALRCSYLSSTAAQPEGAAILADWLDLVRRIVGRDQIEEPDFLFSRTAETWSERELQRA